MALRRVGSRSLANVRLVSLTVAPAAEPVDPPVTVDTTKLRQAWRAHLLVAVLALALGVWVTQGLWQQPYTHALRENLGDQAFFEWLLGYGRYLTVHGADPFFTTMMNAPAGVNLAANTSITVFIVLFSPLTVVAGPQVSYVTILTLNLAGAAFAWYFFLQRHLVRHRAAAALAGLFAGFAPGFISHANGHLNWTAGWVAPLVLWWVLKLRQPGRWTWLRDGAVLGVVLAVGFSIAAEGLFFVALATMVFVVAWSLSRATVAEARSAAPRVLGALVVTAVVAGGLLAYPLYMHFAGPQSFKGTGFNQRVYVEDAAAYLAFAHQSLAGWAGLDSGSLDANTTEQTSFFGVPLLVLIVIAIGALWSRASPGRRATLRALFIVGGTFLVLSLGPRLRILGTQTHFPMPYALLMRLPLFNSALPGRLALVVVGVIAVLLALTVDHVLTAGESVGRQTAWAAGFALALVPLLPVPLPITERAPEPAFIADGTWQKYVSDNGVITTLPFAWTGAVDGQRWQAYTMARGGPQFRIPDGYFLGPGGANGTGRIGAPLRHTDWLFQRVAAYGYLPTISNYDREQARIDFQYWNLQAVFLPPQVTGSRGALFRSALEITATALLGPPERVGDVLVWPIRPGVDPVDVKR
ncbi:MAG: hypothetical protein QOC94_4416 [Actinoplanes sp.]|nr:hypothetical protein [Actinoplanes sp.]